MRFHESFAVCRSCWLLFLWCILWNAFCRVLYFVDDLSFLNFGCCLVLVECCLLFVCLFLCLGCGVCLLDVIYMFLYL